MIQGSGVTMQSFFSKICIIDIPYLALEGEIWSSFVNPKSELYSVLVNAVVCKSSCYIWPHHVIMVLDCIEVGILTDWTICWILECQAMTNTSNQGPDSLYRYHLTSIGNPIVEIRRSLSSQWDFLYWYDLIFILDQGPVNYQWQEDYPKKDQ